MSDTSQKKQFTLSKGQLIGASVIGVVVIIALIMAASLYVTRQNVLSEGNRQEASISGLYSDGANTLSRCVQQTTQSAGLANAETKSLVEVFTKAIGARNQANDQAVFTALKEAYPDTSTLSDTYNAVLATINGCRDDYAGAQTRVLQAVRDFNAWQNGSWRVRTFGGNSFPNNEMKVTVGNQTLYGQAAFDKVSKPIIDTVTDDTYQSDTFNPTDPFGTNG